MCTGVGFIGLAIGSYLHFVEEPSDPSRWILLASGILFVFGLLVQAVFRKEKPKPDEGFPMHTLAVDGTRLLCGRSRLKWDMSATAKLPSAHYRVGELTDDGLVELDPSATALVIVIEGAEKSRHFEIRGFAVAQGERILCDGVGRGVMAVDGDDAYAAMTPALMSPDVNAVEGLRRLDRAIGRFPEGLDVRVLVVSPTADDAVKAGLLMGALGVATSMWLDASTRKKVKRLVEDGLVRDEASGTELAEFCDERGWQLVVE
jgi:hypothetical protein